MISQPGIYVTAIYIFPLCVVIIEENQMMYAMFLILVISFILFCDQNMLHEIL